MVVHGCDSHRLLRPRTASILGKLLLEQGGEGVELILRVEVLDLIIPLILLR